MKMQWEDEVLTYAVEGEGPALVLLHGLSGKADNWILQRRYFSQRYKVLSLDLPGHGASTGRRIHFTDYWRAIDAMLDHAGVAQAALCGLSAGGRAGIDFAARRPDRAGGLIIINAYLSMRPEDRLNRLTIYDLLTKEDGARLWAERLIELMGLEGHPPIERGFLKSVEAVDPLHIRRVFREQDAYDQRTQLGTVKCPVLVLRGAKDKLVPDYCADEIVSLCKIGEFQIMDTGHLPYLEASNDFNSHVGAFLSRHYF